MQKMIESIEYLYLRDKHPFPRGAFRQFPLKDRRGSVYAEPLSSIEEVKTYLRWGKDVFMSIFSMDQRKSGMYDMIFLDIDDSSLSISYMKLHRILHVLDSNKVKNYYVMFSGSKGFHVYVPFKETLLLSYGITVRRWLERLGILNLVDVHVIEPNRVSRIPYSRNLKGSHCIPISEDGIYGGIRQIEEMAMVNSDPNFSWKLKVNSDLSDTLKKLDMAVCRRNTAEFNGGSELFPSIDDYPPCMRRLVIAANKGVDLGHDERLEMGKFMLHVHSGSVGAVSKYYEKMSDFNEVITNYQLQYIKDTGQNISTCERMQALNMCVYAKEEMHNECLFCPSINRIIRWKQNNK